MASAVISGLSSGLDTATIINQLMQLEAVSQTKLKNRVTQEQSGVTALQGLNTKLAALADSAKALAGATTANSTWSSIEATSTNAAVSVTATSSAAPGTLAVTVEQQALTHRLAFTDAHARTDVVGDARLVKDGVETTITGGTLEELATAINVADAGVRASLVRTGTDQYRLLVESTATGEGEQFELTAADGTPLLGGATVRAGQDAAIEIGGIRTTSSTNTFTDVVPGVTVSLGSGATGAADITIARDASTRSDSVKSLVAEVNSIIDAIQKATMVNGTDPSKAGVLAGDSTVRRVASALLESIYPATGSLAPYGLQTDRYGKLVFDEAKFAEAYAADPDGVTAAFTGADGFASRVQQVATAASDRYDGSISKAIESRKTGIERLNDRVEEWDTRLALRRQTLERQYTAVETALSQLQSQSSWLEAQIASLNSSNSK